MKLPEFLADVNGEIFVAGHRIEFAQVIHAYREGASAELIASRYPTLPLSLVHRLIAFYLDNQDEVDVHVDIFLDDVSDLRTKGRQLDLAALRQRLSKGQPPTALQLK